MDPWKEYAAREECRDVVRQWAELEASSPQMTDDLRQRHTQRPVHFFNMPLAVSAGVHMIAWAIDTWRHFTRR
jgi:hypothetical protein